MEADFSERLKRYRKEKSLTQQDLADRVGVSNKTVSRWEGGGGYPDVPVLVPLARALGVAVDDLLDGERPVRTLSRADWQSLLSFAFALGGGVLYFLLDLFMPALVCYLAYLGCMAYGVYLQKYYAYRSRWFLLGNTVMDLSVNVTVLFRCAALLTMIPITMTMDNRNDLRAQFLFWIHAHRPLILIVGALLALAVTVLTQFLVIRFGFRDAGQFPAWPGAQWGKPRLALIHPRLRRLFPAAVPLLACAFWLLYRREDLPPDAYTQQPETFGLCLLVLAALAALSLLRKGDRRWIVPAWCMAALCQGMTGLRAYETAWSPVTKRLIPYAPGLADIYVPLGEWSWGMLELALALSALWVLLQCVRVRWEVPEAEQKPPPPEG